MADTVLDLIERGDVPAVARLLDAGLDPARPVEGGDLPLCWAAAFGQLEVIDLLVRHGADLDATPAHGMGGPAVHDALFAGHTEAAQRLAEAGASLDYPAMAGLGLVDGLRAVEETAEQRWAGFLLACRNGQRDSVDHLVPRGIDVGIYPPGAQWGGIGASGLHWAVAGGHEALVRHLVRLGTPVDIVDDVYGNTPLGWALLDGNTEMVRLLESLGARRELAVS